MKPITHFLLRIENKARIFFERFPFTHAFLAGIGVVLFWRGVWEIADMSGIGPWESMIVGGLLLGCIGLFIHTFVGNAIIIKHVETEYKIEKKTKVDVTNVGNEIEKEEVILEHLVVRLEQIETKLDTMLRK
jgi:hypothetical protein